MYICLIRLFRFYLSSMIHFYSRPFAFAPHLPFLYSDTVPTRVARHAFRANGDVVGEERAGGETFGVPSVQYRTTHYLLKEYEHVWRRARQHTAQTVFGEVYITPACRNSKQVRDAFAYRFFTWCPSVQLLARTYRKLGDLEELCADVVCFSRFPVELRGGYILKSPRPRRQFSSS